MSDILGTIGEGILKVVLPSLGTVIAGFLVLVLKRVAAKYGIEVTEKQEERLKQIVVDKIHATEESSRREPLSSPDKKTMTVTDAVAEATADPSIPNPTREKVSQLVDSELNKVRAGYLSNAGRPGLRKKPCGSRKQGFDPCWRTGWTASRSWQRMAH
jgi:hypothetical protein